MMERAAIISVDRFFSRILEILRLEYRETKLMIGTTTQTKYVE